MYYVYTTKRALLSFEYILKNYSQPLHVSSTNHSNTIPSCSPKFKTLLIHHQHVMFNNTTYRIHQ